MFRGTHTKQARDLSDSGDLNSENLAREFLGDSDPNPLLKAHFLVGTKAQAGTSFVVCVCEKGSAGSSGAGGLAPQVAHSNTPVCARTTVDHVEIPESNSRHGSAKTLANV